MLTILSVFTILLPLITAIVLQRLGIVKSIYMKTAKERKWPFLLSVLWYYLGFELLTNIPNIPDNEVPEGLSIDDILIRMKEDGWVYEDDDQQTQLDHNTFFDMLDTKVYHGDTLISK